MSDEFSEQEHAKAAERFIGLANTLAREGTAMNTVSAALMTASGTYATFSHVGDNGVLTEDEIDQFTDAYRAQLKYIQDLKRERNQA
ncbi:MAG: DUF3144 domain-containing protein [Pseudomonadota bacterium]